MSGRFHQALARDILVSGGEREPAGVVLGAGMFFVVAAWQFVSPVSLAVGVTILTVGLFAIRQIAKRDPKMFAVYRRYLLYGNYYPAHSTPFRRARWFQGS